MPHKYSVTLYLCSPAHNDCNDTILSKVKEQMAIKPAGTCELAGTSPTLKYGASSCKLFVQVITCSQMGTELMWQDIFLSPLKNGGQSP